ncbi:MAG TPA: hypothetical protein VMX13_05790 [Sedimentisphaerales bacterium]|nr:hypothetical protein [Sedimentisphaerales bacterium]
MTKTVNTEAAAMIRRFAVICILVTIGISHAAETSADKADEFRSQYGIIVERNIFSRNRGNRTVEPGASATQARRPQPTPQPESYFVLKGIAKADDSFVAFFEDSRGGEVIRVKAQNPIARGTIVKLTLDSAAYQNDANTVDVKVGQTLEGKPGGTALTFENLLEWSEIGSAAASTRDANGTEKLSDDAEVLRKLMERRRQELGD